VVHVLRAVADRVGGRAGVLGLTRISPFPAEEVREALCRAESVTVLEQRAPEAESTLLLDRVRAAMRGHAACILSATYLRPDASEIAELFANMGAGTAAKSRVALGVAAPGDARRFPRRQALAQRTRRDYPELERATLRPSDAIDLRPPDAKTVLLRLPSIAPPEGPIEALGQLLREVVGAHVAGYSEQKQPGVWEIWLTASSDAMPVACTGLRADVALISNPDSVAAARALADGCCCVVVSRSNGGDLWRTLPPRFRSAIRDRGLRLFRAADVETLIRGGAALASGRSDELDEVPWNELAVDPVERDEVDLPLAVKRLGADSPGPENVARFWGEFAQPRLGDPGFATEIDPHLALGAVPACTASFNEASSARTRIPVIDPDACTGCGNCWVSCPDSAIGAVAIGPQALLDAAADRFGAIDPEPAAGRLRRAHRQLAARWASELSQASPGALPATRLDDAYAGLIDTMKVTEEDRPGFDRAFAPVREWIDALPFGTTDALFHDAERDQKGSGELLLLAVDSRACQACGICAAVCPDDAIRLDSDVAAGMTVQRAAWEAWECLPDTSGKLIARAADDSRVGRLAAVLLSRHCLFSLAGGEGAEPGSGERIAVRQATAVVEYRMQRRRLSQVERLKELAGALRERIGLSLSQAVSVDDLRTLDDALDAAAAARTPIGQVVARMEELGERTDLDVPVVRGLVRTAQELEAATEQILCGLSGAGRARYGIVVSGVERGSWMTTFPRNPFGVPVAVDRDGTGADLALGLAHGFLAECVRDARLVRTAELLLEAPDDLPARKRELAALSWGDLTPDERNVCPPILLVAEAGFGGIAKLLSSELPIKLLLLDPANLESRTVDPLVPELAGARSYVASTSIAHPEHLFDSVMDALDFGGPALIRVHTPSPTRHGFSTESTVERARLAVDCRVRPLLRFAPPESGGIGRGLNLDLNPDVNEPWSHDDAGTELTPTTWAAGETRYANDPDQAHAVRERARSWTTLQELAGVAAPFAAKVEARVEADLRATHQAELASVRADYEGRLEEADKNQARAQAARLRDRLMQLAGYGPPERGAPDRSKG
jgi:pyruvate-ferredoxin/flavodoxin oxidoreductase